MQTGSHGKHPEKYFPSRRCRGSFRRVGLWRSSYRIAYDYRAVPRARRRDPASLRQSLRRDPPVPPEYVGCPHAKPRTSTTKARAKNPHKVFLVDPRQTPTNHSSMGERYRPSRAAAKTHQQNAQRQGHNPWGTMRVYPIEGAGWEGDGGSAKARSTPVAYPGTCSSPTSGTTPPLSICINQHIPLREQQKGTAHRLASGTAGGEEEPKAWTLPPSGTVIPPALLAVLCSGSSIVTPREAGEREPIPPLR